jgi:tetraacyldisaccharide 4'-kinase
VSLRPRSPWQLLYGAAHRLRRKWWARRRFHLPRPVISVGNLHWGGSGKTPLTAAIARHLLAAGYRVAVLSRGYGRQDKRTRIVSIGEGPLLGPKLAGDEPVLLAGEVPGAAVVVAPERFRAGRHAMERLDPPPDVFLLDDGFSHLALARDVDLLVFPSSEPLAGARLWPGGRLREPLAAAEHADALLLSGGSQEDAEELAARTAAGCCW